MQTVNGKPPICKRLMQKVQCCWCWNCCCTKLPLSLSFEFTGDQARSQAGQHGRDADPGATARPPAGPGHQNAHDTGAAAGCGRHRHGESTKPGCRPPVWHTRDTARVVRRAFLAAGVSVCCCLTVRLQLDVLAAPACCRQRPRAPLWASQCRLLARPWLR